MFTSEGRQRNKGVALNHRRLGSVRTKENTRTTQRGLVLRMLQEAGGLDSNVGGTGVGWGGVGAGVRDAGRN